MDKKAVDQNTVQPFSIRYWIRITAVYLLIPLLLFALGGDWGWWQAWIFTALILAVGIGSRLWGELRHPGLLAERMDAESTGGVKSWDKILARLMAVSISFPLVIVAGLDHRFGWTADFSIVVNILGLILIALGYAFASWAMAENRFFSSMVRIQAERGHVVCDSGPYRYIRHPGYGGNILPLAGMVMAFSSLWTLLPAVFALVIIVIRTGLEDRALQEELPGYADYARRVRYRLFPGIF